jgi:hypothetical protein
MRIVLQARRSNIYKGDFGVYVMGCLFGKQVDVGYIVFGKMVDEETRGLDRFGICSHFLFPREREKEI